MLMRLGLSLSCHIAHRHKTRLQDGPVHAHVFPPHTALRRAEGVIAHLILRARGLVEDDESGGSSTRQGRRV